MKPPRDGACKLGRSGRVGSPEAEAAKPLRRMGKSVREGYLIKAEGCWWQRTKEKRKRPVGRERELKTANNPPDSRLTMEVNRPSRRPDAEQRREDTNTKELG